MRIALSPSHMSMRCSRRLVLGGSVLAAGCLGFLGLAGAARAVKLGGFSGVDRAYLVNQDKVFSPLKLNEGVAAGAPSCATAPADVVAKLSFKDPILQTGAKATFAATASGRTLTVTRKDSGTQVVTWTAIDPIGKVVEV